MPNISRARFAIRAHDKSTNRASDARTENFKKKHHPRHNHGTTCAGNFLKNGDTQ